MSIRADQVQAVWEKARPINGRAPGEWRMDADGCWMNRHQYKNPRSAYGWLIDKVSADAPDRVEYLQPFQYAKRAELKAQAAPQRVSKRSRLPASIHHGERPVNVGA